MPPASHASCLSYARNLACSGQPCKRHGLWLQVRGSHGLEVRENLWHGKGSARDALTVQVKCVRTFAGGKIGGGCADACTQLILARSSACKSYVKLIYPRNQCLIPVSISFSSQEHAHISVAHCHKICMTSIPKSRTSTRLSARRRACSASSVSSVCSTSLLLQIVPILARRIRRHSQCQLRRSDENIPSVLKYWKRPYTKQNNSCLCARAFPCSCAFDSPCLGKQYPYTSRALMGPKP